MSPDELAQPGASLGSPPLEPYPLKNDHLIDEWIKRDRPSVLEIRRVLDWILRLCESPASVSATLGPPTMGLPKWTGEVPGTDTLVTFTIVQSPPYELRLRAVVLGKVVTDREYGPPAPEFSGPEPEAT